MERRRGKRDGQRVFYKSLAEKALAEKPRKIKKYTEIQVDNALKKACAEAGWLIFKNHPLTEAGIPDRIIHQKGSGRTFYVELKGTGKSCRPLQIEFHKRLKRCGIETYVLDTKVEHVWDIFTYGYTEYESSHFHKNPFKDKRDGKYKIETPSESNKNV